MPDAQKNGLSATFGAMPCSGIPWVCVWTGPNQESRASKFLRQEGIPFLAPIHKVRLPNRKTRLEPLFRRYIFAQPEDGRIPGQLKPNGITAVLRHPDGVVKIVPQWAIDEILARSDDRGIVQPPPRKKFSVGQLVRAVDGPFTSFVGVCELDDESRVKALMSIFGRSSPVWFAHDALEAA